MFTTVAIDRKERGAKIAGDFKRTLVSKGLKGKIKGGSTGANGPL